MNKTSVISLAACTLAGTSLTGGENLTKDFDHGTPGLVDQKVAPSKQVYPLPKEQMQAAVQKILDDAVKSGAQTAAQVCVYIDGKLVVDAYAGTYEKGGDRKIDGDTLFPIFSTEKPMFVTAVHRAVEQGKLRYDMKVAEVWPEFACNGKENIRLDWVMSHRLGLPPNANGGGFTEEQICDWRTMIAYFEKAKPDPKCPPGTKQGYLSQSYAWYLGEPLCRAMGKPINDVLREQVLIPAGIDHDFYFSVPESEFSRCVTCYNGVERYNMESMNLAINRKACVPSSKAMSSARGIAKFYLRLTGQDGKTPLLKPETLANALKPCRWEGEPVPDAATLKKNWQTVFGLGYGLWGEKDEISRIFGQGGLGGSEGFADQKNRIVIGYTCAVSATACGKPYDLRPEIYRIVGIRTRYTAE